MCRAQLLTSCRKAFPERPAQIANPPPALSHTLSSASLYLSSKHSLPSDVPGIYLYDVPFIYLCLFPLGREGLCCVHCCGRCASDPACGRYSINMCPKASREMNPPAAAFIELLIGHRVCSEGYNMTLTVLLAPSCSRLCGRESHITLYVTMFLPALSEYWKGRSPCYSSCYPPLVSLGFQSSMGPHSGNSVQSGS